MKSLFKITILLCCFPAVLFAQSSVKEVVGSYFTAIGGVEVMNQVNTFYAISETTINNAKLTIHNKQQKPNLKSIEIYKDGTYLSKKVFDGKTGYEERGSVKRVYTEAEILKNLDQMAIFPELYYLENAVYLGEKMVLGRRCHVLGVGEKRIFYDALTGFKLKTTDTRFISGQKLLQSTYYLDYKDVRGVKFPVTYRMMIKDKEIIYNVRSISLNRDVSVLDFK